MGGDPGTVPSHQSESVERNDGADPPVISRVGRIRQPRRWFDDAFDSPAKKQPGTAKKQPGTDKKRLGDCTPYNQRPP